MKKQLALGSPTYYVDRPAGRGLISTKLLALMFVLLLGGIAAAQSNKPPRIGYLGIVNVPVRMEAFRQGLHALGYVEEKNLTIDYQWAGGNMNQLPKIAEGFVRTKVDVIVTAGPITTRAAQKATSSIPIVMAFDNDPVGSGFVASLARPGGNITGLSALAPEISGKQLELLKDIIPKLRRVAVLASAIAPDRAQTMNEMESAAKALRLELEFLDVSGPHDVEPAFHALANRTPGAVVVLAGPTVIGRMTQITELAANRRLPVIYHQSEFVDAGGLMSYGVNLSDLYRRAATYVDKILKGAKPADLPVEQPKKFEFIVNLKAAKHIGLTIPPNVLARADKVIK